ncbi:MAG: hypothetical protein JW833_12390, partial [Prolixibacteraceae bacterium]|nr:hypothetical protein [Prolixibacteraceae bacterium]
MKKKILFTSIGSLVGQNILDSLQGRSEGLNLIGTNSIANAANNFRCNKVYLVTEAKNTEKYINELKQIITEENPDLIIPTRDIDIVLLAQLRKKCPEIYDRFLIGSESFCHILEDKVLSYKFAQKYDLPFAPTVMCGTSEAESLVNQMLSKYGFPFIAKPVRGYGSRGIWIVTTKKQLNLILKEQDYAIQPF